MAPGQKLRQFSTTTPEAWLLWRTHFQQVSLLAQWNNAQKRLQIAASMSDEAAARVAHIDVGVDGGHNIANVQVAADGAPIPPDAPDATALLDAYQAVFMPPEAGRIAIAQYEEARQAEGESLTTWHCRLRNLAKRAEPGIDVENNAGLKRRFVKGLINLQAQHELHCSDPATYTDLLHEGITRLTSILDMDARRKGKAPPTRWELDAKLFAVLPTTDGRIASLNAAGPAVTSKRCYNCDEVGHLQRDCPKARSSGQSGGQQRGRKNGRGRGGRGRGRGGRGRGRGGGRSRSRPGQKQQVNAIDAPEDDGQDDYDEDQGNF